MEFETLLKIILGFAAVFAIPVGAYAAVAATRAIWIKGEPGPGDPELKTQVETLEARVHQLESERERFLELESESISPSGCWPNARNPCLNCRERIEMVRR